MPARDDALRALLEGARGECPAGEDLEVWIRPRLEAAGGWDAGFEGCPVPCEASVITSVAYPEDRADAVFVVASGALGEDDDDSSVVRVYARRTPSGWVNVWVDEAEWSEEVTA